MRHFWHCYGCCCFIRRKTARKAIGTTTKLSGRARTGKNVDRIRLKGVQVVEHETLLWNMGRVQDLAFGPEGYLYLTLNEPDRIVRMVPEKESGPMLRYSSRRDRPIV